MLPLLPPSASVTSSFDVPLATLFSSGGKFITAGNLVADGITFPEYRPHYGGVLRWSGIILVPAIVPSIVASRCLLIFPFLSFLSLLVSRRPVLGREFCTYCQMQQFSQARAVIAT